MAIANKWNNKDEKGGFLNIFNRNNAHTWDHRSKTQILMILHRLKTMSTKINAYIEALSERDKTLFDKLVNLISIGDKTRANIVANEIAQIRSIIRHLTALQYIVDNIQLRLETILLMGESITSLIPIVGIVKDLKTIIKGILPGFDVELQIIEDSIRQAITDSGEITPAEFANATKVASNEAKKILDEAYAVADQKLKNEFNKLENV